MRLLVILLTGLMAGCNYQTEPTTLPKASQNIVKSYYSEYPSVTKICSNESDATELQLRESSNAAAAKAYVVGRINNVYGPFMGKASASIILPNDSMVFTNHFLTKEQGLLLSKGQRVMIFGNVTNCNSNIQIDMDVIKIYIFEYAARVHIFE